MNFGTTLKWVQTGMSDRRLGAGVVLTVTGLGVLWLLRRLAPVDSLIGMPGFRYWHVILASSRKRRSQKALDSCVEVRALEHILRTATYGSPQSVIEAFDAFCWNNNWMMNVGDVKGAILDKYVDKVVAGHSGGTVVAVELGGYCGYSAVRMARRMGPNARIISLEFSAFHAAIASAVIAHAGLADRVRIIVGAAGSSLLELKRTCGIDTVDLLFIDHVKTLYKTDLQIAEAAGLLRMGTLVVADNVIFPGAPDYLEYVRSSPCFHTTFVPTVLEYSKNSVNDGMEVSTYIAA